MASGRDAEAQREPRVHRTGHRAHRLLDELHLRGELSVELAATAKLLGAELQNRLFDDFLQIHGGYGYMADYEIGRAWADARVGRIYGGSSEIMREIIGRTL